MSEYVGSMSLSNSERLLRKLQKILGAIFVGPCIAIHDIVERITKQFMTNHVRT